MIDILNVLLLCAAVFLAVWNRAVRSPYYLFTLWAHCYVLKSKLVSAKVCKSEWKSEGWYSLTMHETSEPDSNPILLRSRDGLPIDQIVELVKIETNGQRVYMFPPMAKFHPLRKCFVVSREERDEINEIAKIVFTATFIITAVAVLCMWFFPVAATILLALACASFILNRPVEEWKKSNDCCIMDVSSKTTTKPILEPTGFNHWSQSERELQDIAMRVQSAVASQQTEMPDENEPADADVEEYDGADDEEPNQTEVVDNGLQVCSCGCIVRKGDTFCSHCGTRLAGNSFPFPDTAVDIDIESLTGVEETDSGSEDESANKTVSNEDALHSAQQPSARRKKRSRGHRTPGPKKTSSNDSSSGSDIHNLLDGI